MANEVLATRLLAAMAAWLAPRLCRRTGGPPQDGHASDAEDFWSPLSANEQASSLPGDDVLRVLDLAG